MTKKIMGVMLVALLVIGVVLSLAGCSSSSNGSAVQPSPAVTSTPVSTPIYVPNGNEPPPDKTWISPGKVNVTNYYPGAVAEYPVTVHNGKNKATVFSVSYRYPDHVGEGYVKAPPEAQDWVIIAEQSPLIAPESTVDILVTLAMPEGADSPDKWEFWISVKDVTQTEMIRTELCVRWLVDMR